MVDFEYKIYGNAEKPQNLVVFIHGYKSSIDDIACEAEKLATLLPQAVVITPQSDKFHKNNNVREWYDVSHYDSEHKRRNPETPLEEVVEIYNQAGNDLCNQAPRINAFIDKWQEKYNIDDCHTYLVGFSQGATLAIYAGLCRERAVGGIFALSGIVAGKDSLEQNINSRPKIYMLHGKQDNIIQFKTLDFSVQWLQNHQIPVKGIKYDLLEHKINAEELQYIAETILNIKNTAYL